MIWKKASVTQVPSGSDCTSRKAPRQKVREASFNFLTDVKPNEVILIYLATSSGI